MTACVGILRPSTLNIDRSTIAPRCRAAPLRRQGAVLRWLWLGWLLLIEHEPQDHVPGVADAGDEKQDTGPRQSVERLTGPQEQARPRPPIDELTGQPHQKQPTTVVHVDAD